MVSHFLLHGIFLNQGSNLHLLHGRQILYHWATREAPPRDVRIKFEIFICNQSVRSLICVHLFATPWTAAHQASLSNTNSRILCKLMSIELVMPSNYLILSCLLLLPSIFPSISVFSNESVLLIRWPKYWSFSFSLSPSNEYSGLIPLEWTGWISLQSKGLSRVSPTPQFKSINFSALSFLYSPTLTFIQDYWKNHSLE